MTAARKADSYGWLLIGLAIATTLPGLLLRVTGWFHVEPAALGAFAFGVAIVGAAFLLTWAAEVAQMDISQGLALAFLALIAVLPEYAVDLYFAWVAAKQPEYIGYATANMTGANRLLIGIAWPLIAYLNFWRWRKREVVLAHSRQVELAFLGLATIYSFVIPLKGTISLIDMMFLVGCFAGYVWRTAQGETEEPELIGPAEAIASLGVRRRRQMVVGLFLFSAMIIFASAEPFAESLVHLGRGWGIDEFLLVQWLAPLASESPEIVIACLLTWKGDAQAGMGAMVSSKVNQWTLLVGTLPFVFSVASGYPRALPLDPRQTEEIFLTAAQSLFGLAVISNLRISLVESTWLLALFLLQLVFPNQDVRYEFAYAYLVLAAALIVRNWRSFSGFFRGGLGLSGR